MANKKIKKDKISEGVSAYSTFRSIERESEEKENESEITQSIKEELKWSRLSGMFIYVALWAIASFIGTFSDVITIYITTGEIILTPELVISFLLNIGFFAIIILFIIYAPKFQRNKFEIIGIIFGIIIGTCVYLLNNLFNSSIIIFNNTEISFFCSIIFIPFLIISIYINKDMDNFIYKTSLILVFCVITLSILNWTDYLTIIDLFRNEWINLILLFSISSLLLYANSLILKIDVKIKLK